MKRICLVAVVATMVSHARALAETVSYVVERDGQTIKFEDATVGLGEDGAVETDEFIIRATGDITNITVTTKASTVSITSVLSLDPQPDTLGFHTRLVSTSGDTYALTVTSESNEHALSHVIFDFGSESQVLEPDETYQSVRSLEPVPSETIDEAIDQMAMFGIHRDDGSLVRYDFPVQEAQTIATVKNAAGTTLYEIDAAAYVPGFENIFGFWTDPSDDLSKLIYIHTETARATVVGQDLGPGHVTGATTHLSGSGGTVFAVQTVEPPSVDFEIDDDTVVPSEEFAAQVTVIGAAISYGGHYDIPVTVKLKANGQSYTPFGPFGKPVNGDVNNDNNPRSFVFPEIFDAGTPVDVLGRSWVKKSFGYSGNYNSHWKIHMTVDGSNTGSPQVKVLRDGDVVPNIPGFLNQSSIEEFVGDFIDPETNTISLELNQAIFLFELGITNLSSSAADFQDLVVLVTLAKDPNDFAANGASSRLLRVDHKTGEYEQLMALSQTYDGVATINGTTFFATHGQEIYSLDPNTETETLLGSFEGTDAFGLEFAGSTLMGFEIVDDTLIPISAQSGAAIASPASLGLFDLGTIVFMPVADDPANNPEAYD